METSPKTYSDRLAAPSLCPQTLSTANNRGKSLVNSTVSRHFTFVFVCFRFPIGKTFQCHLAYSFQYGTPSSLHLNDTGQVADVRLKLQEAIPYVDR